MAYYLLIVKIDTKQYESFSIKANFIELEILFKIMKPCKYTIQSSE